MPARGKALIKTGLSIAIPESTYARIAPRSGLAWKNSIDTGAGVRQRWRLSCAPRTAEPLCASHFHVERAPLPLPPPLPRRHSLRQPTPRSDLHQVIDYDYRGEVGVILFNFSEVDFQGACYPHHVALCCSARVPSASRDQRLTVN